MRLSTPRSGMPVMWGYAAQIQALPKWRVALEQDIDVVHALAVVLDKRRRLLGNLLRSVGHHADAGRFRSPPEQVWALTYDLYQLDDGPQLYVWGAEPGPVIRAEEDGDARMVGRVQSGRLFTFGTEDRSVGDKVFVLDRQTWEVHGSRLVETRAGLRPGRLLCSPGVDASTWQVVTDPISCGRCVKHRRGLSADSSSREIAGLVVMLKLDPETPIDELGLSTRIRNSLLRGRFTTVGLLQSACDADLRDIRQFGPTGFAELKDRLKELIKEE